MKVIVHIGAHKTGTSFIQEYLFRNRNNLLKKGVLYPSSICSGNNHGDFANSFKSKNNTISNDFLKLLKDEVEEYQPSELILSSECFLESKNIPEIFKDNFNISFSEISIVAYLRPQFDWFTSLYNEIVRDPYRRFTGTYKDCREYQFGYYDYEKLLSPWILTFGAKNIIIKAYMTENFLNKSLSDDFIMTTLNLNTQDFIDLGRTERINQTLKPPYVQFLRRVNQLPMHIDIYAALVEELNDISNNDKNNYGELLEVDSLGDFNELCKNDALSKYGVKLPISARNNVGSSYEFNLSEMNRIFSLLHRDTEKRLWEHCKFLDKEPSINLLTLDVPVENYVRKNNVLKRQHYELNNIYRFKMALTKDKNIDREIIKQRIYLRENLYKYSAKKNSKNFIFKLFVKILDLVWKNKN